MILRRLAQNLKEQNWTAIAIEFVLLVLGVFLGIQVANWNAERGDRHRGELFTQKLITDMRVEHWRYRFLLEYYRDVHGAAERALGALDGSAGGWGLAGTGVSCIPIQARLAESRHV